MGYKKDAIKGISWFGILRVATKGFGFIEAIILARILVPEQFGAYGIALLALGLLEVITESGVNIVLIQEDDIDRNINSAWVVSIFRGIVIFLLILASAPFISAFFNSPESLGLLQMISIVPLLRGMINPAIVKLQKELKFSKDFLYRFSVIIVDTVISIIITYLTKNPSGIIIGLIAGVFMELILSFIVVTPRPSFVFERKYIVRIFNRGKWITASSIFDYLFHNADNIMVGRLLGAKFLGIYQLAYSLSAAPLIEVGRVFVHVTVPIFIKISGDSSRLKSAYFKTVLCISVITLPFAFIFASFPGFFVTILGERWSGIASVLPILAVLGFVKSVSLSSTALFISMKKQEYTSVITLVNILGLILSIVPFIMSYQLFGAGISALLGSIIAIPFIIYYTNRTFKILKVKK
ncbi:MAG TPA: oligosaccharide flippase family protein [Candidatus Limnocylindrales bacterium]|nr:oligosaccharide flippase family protein [Candidatus Limnocylindrales bacterium]